MSHTGIVYKMPTLTQCAGLVSFLFYALVAPFALPEWALVHRTALPVMCFAKAFVAFPTPYAIKAFHVLAPTISAIALVIQCTCATTDAADSAWGRANGCEHHTWTKVAILAVQLGVDLLVAALYSRETAQLSKGGYKRVPGADAIPK